MTPKYEQLVQRLRAALPQWYADGQRKLPGEQALAAKLSVSRQTLRQALAVLEQEGLIEKRRGSGSFLCPAAARQDRRIAVIATSLSDYIFPSLLKDVQACLSAQGFSVVIHATENSIRRERDILQQLLLDPPAGILVEGCKTALPNPNAELYQALRQRGLPMTFLHGSCREITDAFCVGDDNYGGGYLLAGHLIRSGHKKIAGIFKSDDAQGPERYHGVVCAMRDAGLFPLDENFLWFSSFQRHQLVELQDEELLRAFLRQQLGGCTAVVCYNDEIAFHLIRTLLRAGKRVPLRPPHRDRHPAGAGPQYHIFFSSASVTPRRCMHISKYEAQNGLLELCTPSLFMAVASSLHCALAAWACCSSKVGGAWSRGAQPARANRPSARISGIMILNFFMMSSVCKKPRRNSGAAC